MMSHTTSNKYFSSGSTREETPAKCMFALGFSASIHLDAGITTELRASGQEVLGGVLALRDGQRVHLRPAPHGSRQWHLDGLCQRKT